ncbi:hypothetical protein D3C78_989900 [compost metagenome]
MIARLKIEIAVVETTLGQLGKNGEQILMTQAVRCEQMFTYQVQTHRFATRSLPPGGRYKRSI